MLSENTQDMSNYKLKKLSSSGNVCSITKTLLCLFGENKTHHSIQEIEGFVSLLNTTDIEINFLTTGGENAPWARKEHQDRVIVKVNNTNTFDDLMSNYNIETYKLTTTDISKFVGDSFIEQKAIYYMLVPSDDFYKVVGLGTKNITVSLWFKCVESTMHITALVSWSPIKTNEFPFVWGKDGLRIPTPVEPDRASTPVEPDRASTPTESDRASTPTESDRASTPTELENDQTLDCDVYANDIEYLKMKVMQQDQEIFSLQQTVGSLKYNLDVIHHMIYNQSYGQFVPIPDY